MSQAPPPLPAAAPKKTRRWLRWLQWSALVGAILVAVAAYSVKDYVRSLNSLRRVPGTHLFVMDYYGDYHIDEIRRRGMDVKHVEDSYIETLFPDWLAAISIRTKSLYVPKPVKTVNGPAHHCSTVALHSHNGDVFFGRNFDWYHDAVLIVRVHDRKGVASISALDLHYLHLNRPDLDRTSLLERVPLLFAPYFLMDGVNRYGVAVSDMAAPADPPRAPGKPAILQSTLMRLILDYAKDADEAVDLVRQYNVHFVDTKEHLMVADSSGRSRVIEFVDGQMCVTEATHPWQVCTNHILCHKSEAENEASCDRYRKGATLAEQLTGAVTSSDATAVIRAMSVPNFTMWTSLYDLTSGQVSIFYKTGGDADYHDAIEMTPQNRPSSAPAPRHNLAAGGRAAAESQR